MADEDDGRRRRASEALVLSIRGKIVEYKELLLRQLLDQRVALLAIDDADKSPRSPRPQADPTGESGRGMGASERSTSEAEAARSKAPVEDVAMPDAASETTTTAPAAAGGMNGHVIASPTSLGAAAAAAAAFPPSTAMVVATTHAPPSEPVVRPLLKRSRSASGVAVDAPVTTRSAQRRVARTSSPPQRYLQPRESEEDEESRLQREALVLRAPKSPVGHKPERTRSRTRSIDEINADFEKKLRSTMRLGRDVQRKTLNVTRKRQLPRLPVPGRPKTHWDFLLEEMKWMATDFSQERNWKRVRQYHIAKDVKTALNAEKVRQEKENRQLARDIAMQVSAFWRTVERIAARSRVRFETNAGSNSSIEAEADTSKESKMDDTPDVPIASALTHVRYKRVEVGSVEESQIEGSQIEAVHQRVQQIVTVGKRARMLLDSSLDHQSLYPDREDAILRLQRQTTSILLTTFQILALRWMMDLFFAGYNVLLNDQLGMGKASTISAFLQILKLLEPVKHPLNTSKPHLIIVPTEEIPKWSHYIQEWSADDSVIQVYFGTPAQRKRLQQEWTKKLDIERFFSAAEVEELEKEESRPIFACVCSIQAFMEDRQAFLKFNDWQVVVVEIENDGRFEDLDCIQTLKQLHQQRQRILCSGQPLETWSSVKLRWEYAEFLLQDRVQTSWHRELWTKYTILEKSSAVEMVKLFGKSSSSIWKAQQDQLSGLMLALMCITLRRVRSEVEAQLGKLEEQSVPCLLTSSQRTQYRNAVVSFVSAHSDRIDEWLLLFLRLRAICNCVDLINDVEKLALVDMTFLLSSSGKLMALSDLLSRVLDKEGSRVVIYCQLEGMLPILEMLLSLMEINCVRITGNSTGQLRGLCHFAVRRSVRVALASTRLANYDGTRSSTVYGADTIIVVDSDWSSTCDAKLRASWAKTTIGKEVQVYRFHCDETIEAALLRVGSCFNEKVFGEMTPDEIVALSVGDPVGAKLEKPPWWTSNGQFTTLKLGEAMGQAETQAAYNGCEVDSAVPLRVMDIEVDAEEHLLLANSDELMPVEWYAVNYIHSVTEKKRQEAQEHDLYTTQEDEWRSAPQPALTSPRRFDEMVCTERKRAWQELDPSRDLYYDADTVVSKGYVVSSPQLLDDANQAVLNSLRVKGADTFFNVMVPSSGTSLEIVPSEPTNIDSHQQVFKISYRVPAPPAPPPQPKLKSDATSLSSDGTIKSKTKKQKVSGGTGRPVGGSVGPGSNAGGTSGQKRKHDLGGIGKPPKEQKVDLDDIPLPDAAEFEDDDFWGDTNLDALDSAAWDDAAVLSGILGPSLDSSPAAPSASNSSGSSGVKKKSKTAGSTGTGRARKNSISDSGKDGWSVQDDLFLKKLFELYGSNWTLIAHVFNTSTSVSRFVYRKRTPRQCYDRYGKIISGGLASNATPTGTPTKEGKSTGPSLKQQKLNAAAAAIWTPEVLAERIGLPRSEMLLRFALRDSLPGIPPPSIANVPTLAELSLKRKKQKEQSGDSSSPLDDLKSIRTSFDAIIQCMKRKTPPPPIPIPQAVSSSTTTDSSDQTAAAAPTTPVPSPKKPPSIVTPVPKSIPPPHKSHGDLVEMLPSVPLAPDEVIKRSKEAAAVAVQAAAAVASAGRESTPVAAAGDVMMGATFGSAAMAARKAQAASLAGARASNPGVVSHAGVPKPGVGHSGWGDATSIRPPSSHPGANLSVAGSTARVPGPVASPGMGLNVAASHSVVGTNGLGGGGRNPTMPVSTSALLHVLDRMPEIKNKIQAILNRNDCSEAQKVAMIARLLSNTNAINATAVAAAASGNMNAAVSATLGAAAAAVTGPVSHPAASSYPAQHNHHPLSSSAPATPMVQASSTPSASSTLDVPIPMPASLANSPSPRTSGGAGSGSSTVTSSTSSAAAAALASALEDTDVADLT